MKPLFGLCAASNPGKCTIEDAIQRIQKYPDDMLKDHWDADVAQEQLLMVIEWAVRQHHGLKARPGLTFVDQ